MRACDRERKATALPEGSIQERRGPGYVKRGLKVHLYLALTVGVLFVVVGVTGSCNVFYRELDELLNPQLIVQQPQGPYRPLDDILQAMKAAYPDRAQKGIWQIGLPRHRAGMMTAWHYCPEDTSSASCDFFNVSVNPYTAEVVAGRNSNEALMLWLYAVHSSLLLGEFGTKFVGILALLLMASLLSGLYLWWPRGGKFKQAFTIKRGASSVRLDFDIHKMSGIYSVIMLFILAFSGFNIVYPSYVIALVKWFAAVTDEPMELQSTLEPGAMPISIAAAVAAAERVFPRELRVVITPNGPSGVYRILKRQRGEVNQTWPATQIIVRNTGSVTRGQF